MNTPLDERVHCKGLTYDDVLLLPDYTAILPHEACVKTQLTQNISLNIPLVSAAMDTVTEANLAIAMAIEGGLGFIHKNMTITDQAAQVKKVKRAQSGMIQDPITLNEQATIQDALNLIQEFKVGGIPIINQTKKPVGIVALRDLRFVEKTNRPIVDIMTKKNLVTAPQGISLNEAEKILQQYKIEKLPIVDKAGNLQGLITYKDILKNKHKPQASKDQYGRLRVGAAVGPTPDVLERVEALQKAAVDIVSIDTAHGHSKGVITACKKIKAKFPSLDVVVGNIVTAEAAKTLVKNGANAVKVGIGPGSICTTRVIAGVGMPQLSAIYEVFKAIETSNVPIIADGGIRFSGDITKAIAVGASCVMIGSLLAGTEETPGDIILYQGRKFKSYRGMGSLEAMEAGSKDRYAQHEEDDTAKLIPQGIVGRVPYKGLASEVLYQLTGGLKAGMGFCGCPQLKDLRKAKFVKISPAGIQENHPHHVQITCEAPNYSH